LRSFFVVVSVFFFCGCSTRHYDVSKHDYFSRYIGISLPLLKAQRLCLREDNINSRAIRTIRLVELEEYCGIRELVKLPKGTEIKIQRVIKQWMPVSGSAWYALGIVDISGNTYEFEYFYGYLSIWRAPWEDETVPIKRPLPRS
jgi:hypothetical protein